MQMLGRDFSRSFWCATEHGDRIHAHRGFRASPLQIALVSIYRYGHGVYHRGCVGIAFDFDVYFDFVPFSLGVGKGRASEMKLPRKGLIKRDQSKKDLITCHSAKLQSSQNSWGASRSDDSLPLTVKLGSKPDRAEIEEFLANLRFASSPGNFDTIERGISIIT